jgi:hypothetical protein
MADYLHKLSDDVGEYLRTGKNGLKGRVKFRKQIARMKYFALIMYFVYPVFSLHSCI